MTTDGERPRVCFVLPALGPGGTERQLLYLLEGLRATHECTVVCTRTAGAWAGAARERGAAVRALDTRGGWDPRIRGRARALLRTLRPHIVQTFLFGLELPVVRAARDVEAPVVVSGRRELAAWMKPRHVRAQRAANLLVDGIVANSHAVAAFAAEQEGVPLERIRVIPNGIDAGALAAGADPAAVRARLGIPADRAVVGMLANFSPVKDHALFLAAAAILIRRRSDIHFLLVGSGPMREAIGDAVRKGPMQDHFAIDATETDAASYLAAMDVCALTSHREGFPNAVLEAMALGRPVVATAVGGIPELIEDSASGLLVASRDPAELAAAFERCIDDAPWARALGAAARERACAHFSAARMVQSYRALYAELLAQANENGPCAASAE